MEGAWALNHCMEESRLLAGSVRALRTRGRFNPEEVMPVHGLEKVSDQWEGARCTRQRRQHVQRPRGEKLSPGDLQ